MTVSSRDRLIITVILSVLIVGGLIGFLVYPQFDQLGKLSAQVTDAESQVQSARLQLQERQGFKDRATETSAKWLRLQNQVPENPDLPSLIIELQDTAFKSGVQVLTVTPAAPIADTKAAGVVKIPISVEIVGTWEDTVDYLEALMRLDRGLRVVNSSTKVTSDAAVIDRRNTKVHAYGVDTIIGLEAYVIPSASATAAPAATQ